jgi:hypothetical protein
MEQAALDFHIIHALHSASDESARRAGLSRFAWHSEYVDREFVAESSLGSGIIRSRSLRMRQTNSLPGCAPHKDKQGGIALHGLCDSNFRPRRLNRSCLE